MKKEISKRNKYVGTKICLSCGKEFPITGYQKVKVYCTDKCSGDIFFKRHGGKEYAKKIREKNRNKKKQNE